MKDKINMTKRYESFKIIDFVDCKKFWFYGKKHQIAEILKSMLKAKYFEYYFGRTVENRYQPILDLDRFEKEGLSVPYTDLNLPVPYDSCNVPFYAFDMCEVQVLNIMGDLGYTLTKEVHLRFIFTREVNFNG